MGVEKGVQRIKTEGHDIKEQDFRPHSQNERESEEEMQGGRNNEGRRFRTELQTAASRKGEACGTKTGVKHSGTETSPKTGGR